MRAPASDRRLRHRRRARKAVNLGRRNARHRRETTDGAADQQISERARAPVRRPHAASRPSTKKTRNERRERALFCVEVCAAAAAASKRSNRRIAAAATNPMSGERDCRRSLAHRCARSPAWTHRPLAAWRLALGARCQSPPPPPPSSCSAVLQTPMSNWRLFTFRARRSAAKRRQNL